MEIQRADSRARVLLGLAVAAAISVGAFAHVLVQDWLADVMLLPSPIAVQKLLTALAWSVAFGSVALVALGIYVWRLGARICVAGRFPPPGTRVIRDTVVLFGAAAIRRGKLIQGAGAVLTLCAIGLAIFYWHSLSVLLENVP